MKNTYKKIFLIILLSIILIYFIVNFTPYFFREILYNKLYEPASISNESVTDPKTYTADSQNIIKLLNQNNKNKEHPRLMARKNDFENIKSQINKDKIMKENFNYLKTKADAILKEEPVKYELSDGVRLASVSSKVLNRVQTLSFVYKITGSKKYAQRAWIELQTISSDKKFPNWHPTHFLDTAEMTNAAAIGYDWLYDYLTNSQKSLIRNAILNKGLKPAIEFSNKEKSPMKGNTNWNSVCNGGIGLGALAIGDEGKEFEEVSGQILENSIKNLPIILNSYAPDGAWYEGTSYWAYSTTYLAYFISALDSSLGTDYNLSKSYGFSSTGYFPIYMSGPGGMFNFSDSIIRNIKSPVFLWLANKFKNGEYKLYYDKLENIKDVNAMTFIWANKSIKEIRPQKQDKYFKGIEAVALHSSLLKNNDSFVGFKSGSNSLNHSDLDIGTFVYDSLGIRWFSDLGAEDYNVPGYWNMHENDKRWQYYKKRAEGQNTLVINPSSKPDQNIYAKTKINTFKSSSKKSFAIADITDAYKSDAFSVKRGMALYKNTGTMIVQDEISTYKPSDIWWFAHTQANIELSEDKKSAVLSKNGKKLLISIISPANGYFDKMKAEPLSSSPNPPNQSNNELEKLTIHLTDVDNTTISVSVSPLIGFKNSPLPDLVSLQDWDTIN